MYLVANHWNCFCWSNSNWINIIETYWSYCVSMMEQTRQNCTLGKNNCVECLCKFSLNLKFLKKNYVKMQDCSFKLLNCQVIDDRKKKGEGKSKREYQWGGVHVVCFLIWKKTPARTSKRNGPIWMVIVISISIMTRYCSCRLIRTSFIYQSRI